MQINVSRVNPDAILPTRNNETDAGIDLYCNNNHIIPPLETRIIRTGIRIDIPEGYFGLIKPKSKNTHLVGAGIVDEGYQGEILVKIININKELTQVLTRGTAVAQLVLIPTIYPKIAVVDDDVIFKSKSDRGNSGGILTQLRMELENNV